MNRVLGMASHLPSLLIPAVILGHLYLAPFTKVEESFNIQAIHDIIVSGIPNKNFSNFFAVHYDHVSFPGSVPRSFVGALVLAGVSRPWTAWITSTHQLQSLVRATLGLFNAIALISLKNAIDFAFGRAAGVWFVLLQTSQFHVMYYASRTLPNMYAFGVCTLALRSLIIADSPSTSPAAAQKLYRLCLYLLTVAGIIFRSEIAILLGAITLHRVVQQRISISQTVIPAGVIGAIIALITTVSVDSFFWQEFPLWPEWSAFYYNTIQGHASDWGVSPWWSYFFNYIPRLLLNPLVPLILIPTATFVSTKRNQSLDLLLPLIFFPAVYSFLPHKEWRFIIYSIPGLTAVGAAGAGWIWDRRSKSALYALLSLSLVGSVLVSYAASFSLLGVSSLNYPGGTALTRLHEIVPHHQHSVIRVHLDNLACQTGVTRFLQMHPRPQTQGLPLYIKQDVGRGWVYDKTEDEEKILSPVFWEDFDYALVESPERAIGKWEIMETIYGYGGVRVVRPHEDIEFARQGKLVGIWKQITLVGRSYVTLGWWVDVKMVPKINILRRPTKELD